MCAAQRRGVLLTLLTAVPAGAFFAQTTSSPSAAPARAAATPSASSLVTLPSPAQVAALRALCVAEIAKVPQLSPQWLRSAFHDAGAWSGDACDARQGGARGCLVHLRDTCEEHRGLGAQPSTNGQTGFDPIGALFRVRADMLRNTSVRMSMADLIQGCAAAAVDSASTAHNHGSLLEKLTWGRIDATAAECPASLCARLPGFFASGGQDRAGRIAATSRHVWAQMGPAGNGFDAREIVALLGAHSIGQTRNQFGSSLDAPWTAAAQSFGNDYFQLLRRVHSDHSTSPFDQAPFENDFRTWWQDADGDVCQTCSPRLLMLDADVALQHNDTFRAHVMDFAADQSVFYAAFHAAYVKMSALGMAPCAPATPAPPTATPSAAPITTRPTTTPSTTIPCSERTAENCVSDVDDDESACIVIVRPDVNNPNNREKCFAQKDTKIGCRGGWAEKHSNRKMTRQQCEEEKEDRCAQQTGGSSNVTCTTFAKFGPAHKTTKKGRCYLCDNVKWAKDTSANKKEFWALAAARENGEEEESNTGASTTAAVIGASAALAAAVAGCVVMMKRRTRARMPADELLEEPLSPVSVPRKGCKATENAEFDV